MTKTDAELRAEGEKLGQELVERMIVLLQNTEAPVAENINELGSMRATQAFAIELLLEWFLKETNELPLFQIAFLLRLTKIVRKGGKN